MTKKDWRETLFVWDGILSKIEDKENEGNADDDAGATGGEVERYKWQGTWVGCDFADASEVPTPKRGAFDKDVTSDNTFEVEGIATMGKADDKKDMIVADGSSSLTRIAMTGGTGYDLGEGSDKKKHKDDTHDMYFWSPTLRWNGNLKNQVENMVLAVGQNEFGNFISVGWLRVGNRVSLARRYVDDSDMRAKWDIDDLKKSVFSDIATESSEDGHHVKLVIPPWQCKSMHADANQCFKRAKKAE